MTFRVYPRRLFQGIGGGFCLCFAGFQRLSVLSARSGRPPHFPLRLVKPLVFFASPSAPLPFEAGVVFKQLIFVTKLARGLLHGGEAAYHEFKRGLRPGLDAIFLTVVSDTVNQPERYADGFTHVNRRFSQDIASGKTVM
jgi:hypothetical protein